MLVLTVSGVQKSMAMRWYAKSGRSWAARWGDQMSRLATSTKWLPISSKAIDAATIPVFSQKEDITI